ncbi:MAG: aquaporin family protein [Bacilli bacterium]|nr:aquaporin family protein [Bacilli bacterium]
MVSLKKQCLSEFLCGLLVGFFGLGCLIPLHLKIIDQFQFSMLFGLAIAFVVLVFNPVSGAQFNPGVTLAMVITKRQDKKTLIPFILAQILGWFCGAALVHAAFYNQIDIIAMEMSQGVAAVNLLFCNYNAGGLYGVFPFEIILTAFMVIVILACNDQRIVNNPGKALFPLVLALYITFGVTLAGPYSGACLNMARDFGPRLFALIWGTIKGYDTSAIFGNGYQFLVYIFVPTLGAVLGALIYDGAITHLLPNNKPVAPVKGVINENYIKKDSIFHIEHKDKVAKKVEVKPTKKAKPAKTVKKKVSKKK